MARLIDGDKLMLYLNDIRLSYTPNDWDDDFERFRKQAIREGLDMAKEAVKDAPTITAFHVIDNKTGKEADLWEIALKEDWAKSLCYCDMEGFAIEQDGTLLLLDECGRHEYCDPDRFEVVWDEGEQKDDEG